MRRHLYAFSTSRHTHCSPLSLCTVCLSFSTYVSALPSVGFTLLCSFEQILNYFYDKLAIILNDVENHRTHEEYDNALIYKKFCFQWVCTIHNAQSQQNVVCRFINNYGTLLYVAFIKPLGENYKITLWPTSATDYCIVDPDHDYGDEPSRNCYDELQYWQAGDFKMHRWLVVDSAGFFIQEFSWPNYLVTLSRTCCNHISCASQSIHRATARSRGETGGTKWG